MHVGVIGGYGPAATMEYDLRIRQAIDTAGLPVRLTLVHGDLKEAMEITASGDEARLVTILAGHADFLRNAGVDVCILSSLSFHGYLDRLSKTTDLLFCKLTEALHHHVQTEGLQRVGVIGSHYAMSEALFANGGEVECLYPCEPEKRDALSQAYFRMALNKSCSDAQRALFLESAESLIERGAESILLGGTDFVVARRDWDIPFPFIDPIDVHVRALGRLIAGKAKRI